MTAQTLPIAKTIALVGLMGVGKSSIGRRLATVLGLPFKDADAEIETAAGRSVAEIFSQFGEPAFREGERRVIARLLEEPAHILATGGGAFNDPQTRRLISQNAISLWLKTDIEVLARRIGRRDSRPLVAGRDPLEVLREHQRLRYPAFETADIIVETGDAPHHATVEAVLAALTKHLAQAQ